MSWPTLLMSVPVANRLATSDIDFVHVKICNSNKGFIYL